MQHTKRLLMAFIALVMACSTAYAMTDAVRKLLASKATITLVQAMQVAVQSVPGTAIDVSLEDGKGVGARYEVEVVTASGDLMEVWVNAATGQVVHQKNDGKAKRKDLQRLEEAQITLHQAVQAATAHTPGTVVGAELDSDWGKTSYQIDVLQPDGFVMEVKVDALTGHVIRSKRD